MTPKSQYQAELDNGTLNPDAEQAGIIDILDQLSSALSAAKPWAPEEKSGMFSRWFGDKDTPLCTMAPKACICGAGWAEVKRICVICFSMLCPLLKNAGFTFIGSCSGSMMI